MTSVRFRLLLLPLKLLLSLAALSAAISYGAISGDVIEFRADSPQKYEVVKGDTLWDISGRFLAEPWLWPEVWQSNPQIKNPDLIYPGDQIELIYVEGRPMLTLRRAENLTVVKLSPQVRREPLLSPIPTISLEDITAYLSRNRVVSGSDMENAPRVIGSQRGKRFSSAGEIVFARGEWNSRSTSYDIIRVEKEFIEPYSERVSGVAAVVVGSATMVSQDGSQGTLRIDNNVEEIDQGDLFVARETVTFDSNYFPQPPSFQLNAAVVDVSFGRSFGGAKDTVIVDAGERDRVEVGHLLTMQKADVDLKDGRKKVTFVGEKFGRILIYKVFRDYSLALVLDSELQIEINDRVITP